MVPGFFVFWGRKVAQREKIDWEKGDKLIRLGQLSAAEIGRQLGCPTSTVTRRIKSKGIVRDKTDEVRTRTRAALITKKDATQPATQRAVADVDDNDIASAVELNVSLILSHRADIKRLANVEQRLLKELGDDIKPPNKLYLAQYQGNVIQKEVNLTVTERASTLSSLANVLQRRIQLERQAFGIDDDENKPGTGLVVLSEQEQAL